MSELSQSKARKTRDELPELKPPMQLSLQFSVSWAIKAMLGVQLAIGVFLFIGDLTSTSVGLSLPSRAPSFEQPTAPGDQTRRYRRDQNPYTGPDIGPMASRLQFDRKGRDLELTGQISPGDAKRFADFIKGLPNFGGKVFLNSPGGSVTDGLEIGRAIRAEGWTTRVAKDKICLSACPYILAGGAKREVSLMGHVGVHQHYFGKNTVLPAFLAVEDIQRGQGEVMGYLVEMGISPLLMMPALVTPPDEIYILTRAELLEYGVLDGGDT